MPVAHGSGCDEDAKSNFHQMQLKIWVQAAQQSSLEGTEKLGETRMLGLEFMPGELMRLEGPQIAASSFVGEGW